ncbi:hypothetical protein JQ617_13005 [Bradyrhizobium sp. KB893862 SZCCT0404]|uniref:hypothetical protein n=1 Tax=Bradyrhizobium sp. KB893862 SZCCT0404 TaxID=2807672 RepID=UPI001BA804C1|nr:hypothetical protein [Bradyrhizobium sp. KB893862 SZCCT0404]MBR1174881.1 hypothetical protein [Bradyrhizobium sp. KB893862 SZCCT0404]
MRQPLKRISAVLFILLVIPAASEAEENLGPDATTYAPRLSDLMISMQIRHAKLFFAAKRGNWGLAAFELEQISASLKEAGRFYPKVVSTSDLAVAAELEEAVAVAVKAKDEGKFERSFDQMSGQCNRCHRVADRDYIFIRRPLSASAFSNQSYGVRRHREDDLR